MLTMIVKMCIQFCLNDLQSMQISPSSLFSPLSLFLPPFVLLLYPSCLPFSLSVPSSMLGLKSSKAQKQDLVYVREELCS